MTLIEKYNKTFMETFNVPENQIEGLTYQCIQAWDSVGHMNLISALEDNFDIMLETDDIVELSSYKKGIEILKKNGIEL